MIETTCKVIMCMGNVGKLPVFSCFAFPNRLSVYLDRLMGMEMAWCWIMSGVTSTGNAGIQIFSMLYSICRFVSVFHPLTLIFLEVNCAMLKLSLLFRVRLLLENNPGRIFNKWKLLVHCIVGLLLMLLHFGYFLRASPYVHPLYRSCIMPQQPSFLYAINQKLMDKKNKIWNLNLLQLFVYNYITFGCHILIIVVIRRRSREIRQVQEGSEFRASIINHANI